MARAAPGRPRAEFRASDATGAQCSLVLFCPKGFNNNACHNGGYQISCPAINSDCSSKAVLTLSPHLATGRPVLSVGRHNRLVSLFGILPRLDHCPRDLDATRKPYSFGPWGHELPKFQLVIHARQKPPGTYTYVIARRNDRHWSEVGAGAFKTLDEAAEAGRLAIDRLEALHRTGEP
jgi:hypothetical protein